MWKAVAALAALTTTAGAAQPTDVPRTPCAASAPGGRAGAATIYHPGLRRVVLFGGSGDAADPFPRSLWAWGGARWSCLSGDGPPGRNTADLAYDPTRDALVLHGGRDRDAEGRSRILTATWEWNGARWAQVSSSGPPSRIHFVMAYDARRRAVLLFGGISSKGEWYRDTWAWNGAAWSPTTIAPAPDGIPGRAMRLDGDIVIMIATPDKTACGDLHRPRLFTLRGDAWEPRGEPGPCFGPSSPAPIAWTHDGPLLYSGWNGREAGAPIVSTILRGGAWRPVDDPPARRRSASASYDDARRRVVLVGGETDAGVLDEVWESDGARWRRVPIPRP